MPSPQRAWFSPAGPWQRKTTIIAALSVASIVAISGAIGPPPFRRR